MNFKSKNANNVPEPSQESLEELLRRMAPELGLEVGTPETRRGRHFRYRLLHYFPKALAVALLCMVLAPLIYVPVRRRLDKKNKARMTALLTEHERRYHGKPWEVGSLLYANATDCTRETLHTFSLFHAYVKQIRSVVLGTVLCTTERIQRKEYSRGLSSTAQYMFYEDGFRVSGVQPMSVYPYFKILSVRRWDRYIYLYTDADNAWILDKNGFSVGEADAFVAFIRAKVASFQEKGKGPGKQ